MSDMMALTVNGDYVDSELYASEGFRVQVEGNYDDSYSHRCEHCNAPVDEEGTDESGETECPENSDGWAHDDDEWPDCGPDCPLDGTDENGLPAVGSEDHYTRETFGAHSPVAPALDWLNSCAIDVDARDDSATVSISVGDPRGAFGMTVRRITPDEGRPYLIMHTPYPGESWAHMPLAYVAEGTYRVQPYGGEAQPDPRTLPAPEPTPAVTRRQRARRWLAVALRNLAGRVDF
jgi:hypothetical protein